VHDLREVLPGHVTELAAQSGVGYCSQTLVEHVILPEDIGLCMQDGLQIHGCAHWIVVTGAKANAFGHWVQ
jgi:hypothetical protein